MPYDVNRTERPHSVILEGREKLSVSGVEDVESFDEDTVVIFTSRGTLIVKGADLRIEKLSLDQGELAVEGTVYQLHYEDTVRKGEGLWQRLFR